MNIDDKFDLRDCFQEAFAKLVAAHLDKCETIEEVLDLEPMLQDCTSVYGCAWRKHSKNFPLTRQIR